MTHLSRPTVTTTQLRSDGTSVLSIAAGGRRVLIDPAHIPVFAEDLNTAVKRLHEQDQEGA